jgi:2-pyrone-4,6-dicarboxylate lactonase
MRFGIPVGACDTHCHVIGPHDGFPTLPTAGDIRSDGCQTHLRLLDSLGLDRAAIVHPSSVYGDRHDALIAALRTGRHRYRGIAVARSDVSERQLEAWADVGICALRFVDVRDAEGRLFPGSAGFDDLERLAPRLRELGWHAQIWADCREIVAREAMLVRLGIPLVLDHMGRVDVAAGTDDPAFVRLLKLVRDGLLWVKLTLCRTSRRPPDYDDLRPFHDALVAANPLRMLWGSDWPHLRMGPAAPDPRHLLGLFQEWVGDEEICARILAVNPATLFDFPAPNER